MSASEHHGTAILHAISRFDARHRVAIYEQRLYPCGEMNLATGVDDGVAYILDDARELIGAYMGMSVYQYALVGAMLIQKVEDILYGTALLAAGKQFTVAIRARATFAEAIVGIGIYQMFFRDFSEIDTAAVHIFTALKDYRLDATFHSPQTGKQSGRACAYDDYHRGLCRQRTEGHRLTSHRQCLPFGGNLHTEIYHNPFLSRIDGAALDAPFPYLRR
jgi:hypothetical protein